MFLLCRLLSMPFWRRRGSLRRNRPCDCPTACSTFRSAVLLVCRAVGPAPSPAPAANPPQLAESSPVSPGLRHPVRLLPPLGMGIWPQHCRVIMRACAGRLARPDSTSAAAGLPERSCGRHSDQRGCRRQRYRGTSLSGHHPPQAAPAASMDGAGPCSLHGTSAARLAAHGTARVPERHSAGIDRQHRVDA